MSILFLDWFLLPEWRQDTFPQDCPPPLPKTDRKQDCHNVAVTSSTDTQFGGIAMPRWDTRQQWVRGREEVAAAAPRGEEVPAVSAGDDTLHMGDGSPGTGSRGP